MQLRKILILSTIDDQTIGGETKFIYKALNGGEQIGEKSGICRIEFFQGSNRFLGKEKNMKWIGWLRVMKRHQGLCFAQSFNGNGEIHVLKSPADEMPDPGVPYPFLHSNLLISSLLIFRLQGIPKRNRTVLHRHDACQ